MIKVYCDFCSKKANILTQKDIRDHVKLLLYNIKPSWWPKSYDELIHNKRSIK